MGTLIYRKPNRIGSAWPIFSGLRDSGILLPPLISSIRQWTIGVNDAGDGLTDKISPLIVSPEPIIKYVNCLEFGGTNGHLTLSATLPSRNIIRYEAVKEFPVGIDGFVEQIIFSCN